MCTNRLADRPRESAPQTLQFLYVGIDVCSSYNLRMIDTLTPIVLKISRRGFGRLLGWRKVRPVAAPSKQCQHDVEVQALRLVARDRIELPTRGFSVIESKLLDHSEMFLSY